jgi:hypothetical protein
LQISLADVSTREVVVTGCGDREDKAQRRDFRDGGEHAVEVDTPLLRVAVGDKATLELVDAAVLIALDGEDHVAA